jgi:hypothetical protein
MEELDAEILAAQPGSVLAGFGVVWRRLRGLPEWNLVEPWQRKELASDDDTRHQQECAKALQPELVRAIASSDVFEVGRLLGVRDARRVAIDVENMSESIVRRPRACSLLDAAIGLRAAEVAKYLLEFHSVHASRETMKTAISTGVLVLIRLVWDRLPECQRGGRTDLLQEAADFHREDVLAWLFRGATPLEREVFAEFALGRHLADALIIATQNGPLLWSNNARVRVAAWPVASTLEFVAPPDGLSIDSGWWVDLNGKASTLEPQDGQWVTPPGIPRGDVAQLVLPFGVTQLGLSCVRGCTALTYFWIPETVTEIGWYAFADGQSLRRLVIPASVTSIDASIDGGWSYGLQIVMAASTDVTCDGI